MAGNDQTGLTRRFFLDARPGDQIEVALTPRGADGSDHDGSDSSSFWMAINPALPANPTQPDGMPFMSLIDNDGDGLPDQWERENFGNLDEGANDDPNGNGFDNLADLVLGFDPAHPGPAGTLTVDGGNLTELGVPRTDVRALPDAVDFSVLYSRRSDLEDLGLLIMVEFSHDMTPGSWFAGSDPGTVIGTAPGLEVLKIGYPFFLPNGRKARFWRIVVTKA
ncbi:MAG: hypothetical protein GWO24_23950 [Akkermansiaceae bacterium]|nr:hypothetical protein [Akkermansiaceae bacterium]